jgi:DNA invertase Pin-like site-specific DNA recombinase
MIDIENTGQRVAVYARVSAEEQKEVQTINSKAAELEAVSLGARDGPSAGSTRMKGGAVAVMERPGWFALRDDAREGYFRAVLINAVDRLARGDSYPRYSQAS